MIFYSKILINKIKNYNKNKENNKIKFNKRKILL
jgi:hypothetical protein